MTSFSSCCVLAYERPEFLARTINSLEENTDFPHELIIHDDGSKDDVTSKFVRNISETLGATVIINKPGHNQGQGIALNRMFYMAKGDYICKLDADLKYHPGWLNEVNRLMNENEEIGLLGLMHYYHEPVHSHLTVIDRHDDWSSHTHILGSAFAMSRECWEHLGPFPEHSDAFAEDWEMQQRVTASEDWVCALPKESLVSELDGGTMGYGKSALFLEDGSVRKIHKAPYLRGNDE